MSHPSPVASRPPLRFSRAAAAAVGALLLLAVPGARAAPKADPWQRWSAHDETSQTRVDHEAWSAFLARYVSADRLGVHRVDYGAVTREDRAALAAYLGRLGATPVSTLRRDEQRAFWINLYNGLTVRVILDHYPVASILDIDISPGLFAQGPWGKKLISVEGQPVSLDDIEHRILRPLWRDPRIHYAVNCASRGCPNLRKTAFSADRTEATLERSARDFVNHPRGARVAKGELTVSSLYRWFEYDFGGDDAGVLAHLRRYAAPELRRALDTVDSIDDDQYDWSLNDSADAP